MFMVAVSVRNVEVALVITQWVTSLLTKPEDT